MPNEVKRWVNTKDGPMEVDAITFGIPGLFINHLVSSLPGTKKRKGIDKYFLNEDWWVITHRWTGLRITGKHFSKKRDAIRVAKHLTETYDIDWDIRDPDILAEVHPDLKRQINKTIREIAKGQIRDGK